MDVQVFFWDGGGETIPIIPSLGGPSFKNHPKIWRLKFTKDENIKYINAFNMFKTDVITVGSFSCGHICPCLLLTYGWCKY